MSKIVLEHDHHYFMGKALVQAQKAFDRQEVPIGCVIVNNDKIVSEGYNLRETKNDPTAHAEMLAIKKAAKKLGSWRLNECDIYVTLEPCPMCMGAILQSRMRHVYFGAYDPKGGACGSLLDMSFIDGFNHRVECSGGILEEECSGILKDFFKMLRDKKRQ